MIKSPTFDWAIYGEGGQHSRTGYAAFDYDKHHNLMNERTNVDPLICGMGIDLSLALHYGDMQSVNENFERATQVVHRMLGEPNPAPDAMNRFFACAGVWPCLLGKRQQMAGLIEEMIGGSWTAIEVFSDEIAVDNAFTAPRGKAGTGTWVVAMDIFCWCVKLNLALCAGTRAVSKQDVMDSLPTPHQLAEWSRKSPDTTGGDIDANPHPKVRTQAIRTT